MNLSDQGGAQRSRRTRPSDSMNLIVSQVQGGAQAVQTDKTVYGAQRSRRTRPSNKVFETIDLLRHIYSFGPEHRENMAKVCERIKCPQAEDLPACRFVPPSQKDALVQFYRNVRCHCCSRHTHFKPTAMIYHKRLVFYRGSDKTLPESKNLEDCECYCRHLSRNFISKYVLWETVLAV